jgi:hypothetical protein
MALRPTESCALIKLYNPLISKNLVSRGPNKGDTIVKFHSLTRYLVAFASALLLVSCGGGGSAVTTETGGPTTILPNSGTLFAGVPFTLTIQGGGLPYTLSSSEPGLLPVPTTLNGHSVTLVPNNPAVIDAGLQPDELPVRTVIISVRNQLTGDVAVATFKVARNFLTGYGFSFGNSTCRALAAPCAGGDTVVIFDSTTNGNLQPNHTYRVERVRGTFSFVDPLSANSTTESLLTTSDSSGRFTVIMRVPAGTPTQLAIMRVTDVTTGASSLFNFVINGTPAGAMTLIPATVTLTGPNGSVCGFGTFDVLVFDGTAPYTAICPNPQIQVSNPTSNPTPGQPGRFTFTVGASNTCLTGEQCVISDSTGTRSILTITTIKGTTVPPTPITATPNSLTLTCGASGNVTVTGGNGNYSANSTHPRVTATVSGNTVTITRLAGPEVGGPFPTTASISVTDGSTATPITATVPANCP